MLNFTELEIITNNAIEGNGFKSFFEINRPAYKVNLILQTAEKSDYKIENFHSAKTLIILDTDSFENLSLVKLFNDIAKHELKCIIYSRLTTPGLVLKAKQLGLSGYVSKASPLERLLDCLKVIELGGIYYDPCFSALLKEISDFTQMLSPMQQNLLYEALLFPSRSIREIAESLKISKHTAEVHLSNLYQKIGVHTFNELVDRFSL